MQSKAKKSKTNDEIIIILKSKSKSRPLKLNNYPISTFIILVYIYKCDRYSLYIAICNMHYEGMGISFEGKPYCRRDECVYRNIV